MPDAPFIGQSVIVTGASSGIGAALARQLAGQGARVALAARRLELLEQVAGECRKLGGEALVVPCDVSDEAQCKALVEASVDAFGGVDMLVANAGIAASALLEDFTDLHLFKQVVDVNFYGAVYCTYHALPYLKRSHGRILAVSSLGGIAPLPYNTPYISSKYAMHGFYDTLRMEMRQHGVSVTVGCPYWVVTGFHEAQMDKDGVPLGKRGREFYTKRMMSSERCAVILLKAAQRRKRQVLMGPGHLAAWARLLAPGLLDRATEKVVLEPIRKRVSKG